jgi:hypothetical protein
MPASGSSISTARAFHSHPARRAIIALLTVGGAGYPVGYLVWSALIPYYGVQRGKTVAEWLVWIPFGGAAIVAVWWLTALVGLRLLERARMR